jgi:hypothetical protein
MKTHSTKRGTPCIVTRKLQNHGRLISKNVTCSNQFGHAIETAVSEIGENLVIPSVLGQMMQSWESAFRTPWCVMTNARKETVQAAHAITLALIRCFSLEANAQY